MHHVCKQTRTRDDCDDDDDDDDDADNDDDDDDDDAEDITKMKPPTTSSCWIFVPLRSLL